MKENIEIIDDIVEDEIIVVDDSTTYAPDNSLNNMSGLNLGNVAEGTSTNDALKSFNTDDTMHHIEMPIDIIEIKEERPKIVVENPDLNSDLDNTLLLAKQAIKPEAITVEVKKEQSDNGAIAFIIILFLLLTAFIVALPYITDLLK